MPLTDVHIAVAAMSAGARGGTDGPTIEELRDLPITLASGQEITVGSVAALERTRSPFFIQRLDRETVAQIARAEVERVAQRESLTERGLRH